MGNKINEEYYQHTDDLINYLHEQANGDDTVNKILLYQEDKINEYNKIKDISKKTGLLSGITFLVTGSRKFGKSNIGKKLRVISGISAGASCLLNFYSSAKLHKYSKENESFQEYVNSLDENIYADEDLDVKNTLKHTRTRK